MCEACSSEAAESDVFLPNIDCKECRRRKRARLDEPFETYNECTCGRVPPDDNAPRFLLH